MIHLLKHSYSLLSCRSVSLSDFLKLFCEVRCFWKRVSILFQGRCPRDDIANFVCDSFILRWAKLFWVTLVGYWRLMFVNLSWNTHVMVLFLTLNMSHPWYERLVKVDFINIQNFQPLHLLSCSSDSVTIYYSNCLFLSRSDFLSFVLCLLLDDKFP